jgi:hypothetical protein
MESAATEREGVVQVPVVRIATLREDRVTAYKAQTY